MSKGEGLLTKSYRDVLEKKDDCPEFVQYTKI